MTKINKCTVKGGAFEDVKQAVDSLNSLLAEVRQTGNHVEKERTYRSNVSGLQECIFEVINGSTDEWKETDVHGLFLHRQEEVNEKKYSLTVSFEHPLYEHVWLTDKDGNNLSLELIPFLKYTLEYLKEKGVVKVSHSMIDAKLNLPDLATSLKRTRKDPGLLRAEAERVGNVVKAATYTQSKLTTAVRNFCSKNNLKIKLANGADQELEFERVMNSEVVLRGWESGSPNRSSRA
jgi:hypothetical protein